jgi:hypothetical protein
MKTTIVAIAAVAFLLLPIRGPAQTNTIPWSVSGIGFEVSSSSTTILKSLVGQRFVGTLQGASTIIESGFLADTLFRTLTSVASHEGVPKEFMLEQNFPNPFNPSTTIHIELPHASRVILSVYNVLGQEVLTLIDEEKPAGIFDVRFSASNLSSGTYLYRLRAGEYVSTKRMLVLK